MIDQEKHLNLERYVKWVMKQLKFDLIQLGKLAFVQDIKLDPQCQENLPIGCKLRIICSEIKFLKDIFLLRI